MSDVKSVLREEIEHYLNHCGLHKTLDVFRSESEAMIKMADNKTPLITNKSTFAKRYFENKAEISKTRLKVCFARRKLAALNKELAKLDIKLKDIAIVSSKHVLINLELLNTLETKIHSDNFLDSNNGFALSDNKDIASDWEAVCSDLVKNITSILTAYENEYNAQGYFDSVNHVADHVIEEFDGCDASSYINIASQCSIIPDAELRNIYPLTSVISLLSKSNPNCSTVSLCSSNHPEEATGCFSLRTKSKDATDAIGYTSPQLSHSCLSNCQSYASRSVPATSSHFSDCYRRKNPVSKGRKDEKSVKLCEWHDDFQKTKISILKTYENEIDGKGSFISVNSVADHITEESGVFSASRNMNDASECSIIPDAELRNIYPLTSVISLLSSNSFNYRTTNLRSSKYPEYAADCFYWRKKSKDVRVASSYTSVESPNSCPSSCQSYTSRSVSAISSQFSDSYCRNNPVSEIQNNERKVKLHKWCDDFLKRSNRTKLDASSKASSLESIYDGISIESSSIPSSAITLNSTTDLMDSDIIHRRNYTCHNTNGFETLTTHKEWPKASLDKNNCFEGTSSQIFHQQENMHFWKENDNKEVFNKKIFKINVTEPDESNLLRILHDVPAEHSQKLDSCSSQHVLERLFPDTHLSKDENKMPDNIDCVTTLYSKTPSWREKVKEFEPNIFNNIKKESSNSDLSSTYTIQKGSRLKTCCEKGTDEVCRCRKSSSTLYPSSLFSDKSADKVKKRIESPKNNDGCDLSIFSTDFEIIEESNSRNSVRKVTSNSSSNRRLNNPNKVSLGIEEPCHRSELMKVSDYFEFRKGVKLFKSSSVIDTRSYKSKKNYGSISDNFVEFFNCDSGSVHVKYNLQENNIFEKSNFKKYSENESLSKNLHCTTENDTLSSAVKETLSHDSISEKSTSYRSSSGGNNFTASDPSEDSERGISLLRFRNESVQRIQRNVPFSSCKLKAFKETRSQRKTLENCRNRAERMTENDSNNRIIYDTSSNESGERFRNNFKRELRRWKQK